MSAFSVIFSSPIVGRGFRAVAFLACFSCAAALVSAEEKERPYLSDEVGEQLGKVRPLFDEKKWDEALVIIDKVYAKAKPGSYDQAVLLNTKVQVYLSRNEFAKAIPCMEESLRISTQFGYFEPKQNAELTYLLAQLYYSEGVSVKRSAEDQRTYFLKALEHIEKWDALTLKPTIDQLQFYASVLFNIAQSYGEAPATKAQKIVYVKRAQAQTLRALQDAIRPKEPFYMLMVACAQELADYAQMAEYLELLVSQYPSNSQYWQQLFGCYVNLAGAQAKEKDSLPYNVRAILALERAQAVGQIRDLDGPHQRIARDLAQDLDALAFQKGVQERIEFFLEGGRDVIEEHADELIPEQFFHRHQIVVVQFLDVAVDDDALDAKGLDDTDSVHAAVLA